MLNISISSIIEMLTDQLVLDWIRGNGLWENMRPSEENRCIERDFAYKYIENPARHQWTTKFGEQLVQQLLANRGVHTYRCKSIQGMKPDFESDDAFYEVKTRSYSVSGTAGEKILATPYKYRNLYRLTGKPLFIVLVANQELEARNRYHLDEPTNELESRFLDFIRDEYHVSYLFATQLLT